MAVSAVLAVRTDAECITGMRAVARRLAADALCREADASGNLHSEGVVDALLESFIISKMALSR